MIFLINYIEDFSCGSLSNNAKLGNALKPLFEFKCCLLTSVYLFILYIKCENDTEINKCVCSLDKRWGSECF